jgi:hypothetical protein
MKVERYILGGEEVEVGQVLDNGAVVTSIEVEAQEDGSEVISTVMTYDNGAQDFARTVSAGPGHPLTVQADVTNRLVAAMIDNVFVLQEPSELAGIDELRAHVVALTRQVNALIRVVLNRFDDDAGT